MNVFLTVLVQNKDKKNPRWFSEDQDNLRTHYLRATFNTPRTQ